LADLLEHLFDFLRVGWLGHGLLVLRFALGGVEICISITILSFWKVVSVFLSFKESLLNRDHVAFLSLSAKLVQVSHRGIDLRSYIWHLAATVEGLVVHVLASLVSLEGLAEEVGRILGLQAHFVRKRFELLETWELTVACGVHWVISEVELVVGDEDDYDVEILVLRLDKTLDVLGLMIGSEHKHNPLHGPLDDMSFDGVDLILLDTLQALNRFLDGGRRLQLHLAVPELRISATDTILLGIQFVVGDQILSHIVQVLILYQGVHLFGLQQDDIVQVLGARLGHRLLTNGVRLDVGASLVGDESILQYLEPKVVIRLQGIEQLLGQVHRRFQHFGIREGARVQEHLHVLLRDVISREEQLLRNGLLVDLLWHSD